MQRIWLFVALLPSIVPAAFADEVDLAMVSRIKDQAFNHSRVAYYMHFLADRNGARLAGSPAYRRAADWAVEALEAEGIDKVGLESFNEIGRSWTYSHVSVRMLTPQQTTLVAVPVAFSAGTDGPLVASVIYAPLWDDVDAPGQSDLVALAEQIESYKRRYAGQLRDRVVLLTPLRPFALPGEPVIQRHSDEDLESMQSARDPVTEDLYAWPRLSMPDDDDESLLMDEILPIEIQADFSRREARLMDRLVRFLNDEGAVAIAQTSTLGGGGVVFVEDIGSHSADAPVPPPTLQLMPEHYNRLVRLLQHDTPATLSIDVDASFPEQHAKGTNVIAEIPGGRKRDEIVMLGAHLDSWHAGTGATDNAAGVAVVMEALRILKALDVPMDRTVRIGLWDGEEIGHLGSLAYVREHLGDPMTMALKPAHEKFSVYYNIDTGSGRTRGILTQANDMVRPIFEQLMMPFAEHGLSTLVPRNDWGTDHQSFDAVGLPSFDMLQDELDYWSHTHHSNVDTIDHVLTADQMISAAFMATLAYHAAMRDDLMPREALPRPLPPPRELPAILQDP
jgi:carboxypeptidase Q